MIYVHIYIITNLINGKIYVGRTKRKDSRRRWREHKKDARKNYAKYRDKPLYRAINKYGEENFKFEVIESNIENGQLLALKETEYIIKYNSLTPNGYNLELYQEDRILTKECLEGISKNNQGKFRKHNKTSKYIGVSYDKHFINCEIGKNRHKYKRVCETEEIAAESYDKLALFLYGDTAKLNFPQKFNEYKQENLQDFFNKYCLVEYSSKYNGVTFNKTKQRWRASLKVNNKCFHIKYVKNEIEAAELYDKACVFFKKDLKNLNFPEKIEQYNLENLSIIFNKKKKFSKYRNVCYTKRTGKWSVRLIFENKIYFCGNWDTEIKAAEEFDKAYMKITNNVDNLNFPEKIEQYKNEAAYIGRNYKKK